MSTATISGAAIVGVFRTSEAAQRAVVDLYNAGFEEHEIGFLRQNAAGDAIAGDIEDLETGTKAAEGAATGLAAGAGLGAVGAIAIAAGFLPVVGPAVAGGFLASLLASAASGAVVGGLVGGLVGTLVGLGIPEDEARHYELEVLAGRTIVTVHGDHDRSAAAEIFERHVAAIRPTASSLAETVDCPPEWSGEAQPCDVPTSTPHAVGDLPHAEIDQPSADPRLPR